jgi:hypothetical protein
MIGCDLDVEFRELLPCWELLPKCFLVLGQHNWRRLDVNVHLIEVLLPNPHISIEGAHPYHS